MLKNFFFMSEDCDFAFCTLVVYSLYLIILFMNSIIYVESVQTCTIWLRWETSFEFHKYYWIFSIAMLCFMKICMFYYNLLFYLLHVIFWMNLNNS